MKDKERKKVIVVNGCFGVGRAVAISFAGRGCNVLITYNETKKFAEDVVQELRALGAQAHALEYNFLVEKNPATLIEQSVKYLGDIHYLILNTNVLPQNPFLALSPAEIKEIFAVNAVQPFQLVQSAAKYIIDKQRDVPPFKRQNHCIINIASLPRGVSLPGEAVYEMSQAAISQMAGSLAHHKDFKENNIRINEVVPGATTDYLNHAMRQTHLKWWQRRRLDFQHCEGNHEDIANIITQIALDLNETGKVYTVPPRNSLRSEKNLQKGHQFTLKARL